MVLLWTFQKYTRKRDARAELSLGLLKLLFFDVLVAVVVIVA